MLAANHVSGEELRLLLSYGTCLHFLGFVTAITLYGPVSQTFLFKGCAW